MNNSSIINAEYYTKVLEDLKSLELQEEDSDDNDDQSNTDTNKVENKLNTFRRKICGIENESSRNATDDLKVATELNLNKLYDDLNVDNCSIEIIENISKLIAELAKDEECRNALVEKNFFIPLNKSVSNPNLKNSSRTQICRAIGNLCYYNDTGRLSFLKSCGIKNILDMCIYCSRLDYVNSSDEDKKEKNTLISVVLGCLHNITNENETLRKAAYELNFMSALREIVPYLKYYKGILIHFGSCIENLTEMNEGKEQFVKEKLALALYQNLDEELILSLGEYTHDFFEILTAINSLEQSKNYLCETNFLEKLIQTMENNLENKELLREIGLFIVSLLITDDNVDIVFEYKNNLVLERGLDWLDKYENEQLYVTSAVILANYMRSDASVLKIIKDPREPHVKILNILKKYNQLEDLTLQQINVIHSLLGALRNFCVAVATRDELLMRDVISIVLPFIKSDTLDVKCKALSIIRLLIKGSSDKTGLDLLFEKNTLEILENLANNPTEHVGITGEMSRLLCYMPIAAKTEKRIKEFCAFKVISTIVGQLKSEYLIMLNEALLALNVLVTIDYRACYDQLKSSNLSENLMNIFKKEKVPVEMCLNSMRLFKFLLEKNDIFSQDQLKDHLEIFKKAKTATEVDFLKTNLEQLISLIETQIDV